MVGPMILINKGQLATLVMHARGSLLQNVLFLFCFVLGIIVCDELHQPFVPGLLTFPLYFYRLKKLGFIMKNSHHHQLVRLF